MPAISRDILTFFQMLHSLKLIQELNKTTFVARNREFSPLVHPLSARTVIWRCINVHFQHRKQLNNTAGGFICVYTVPTKSNVSHKKYIMINYLSVIKLFKILIWCSHTRYELKHCDYSLRLKCTYCALRF